MVNKVFMALRRTNQFLALAGLLSDLAVGLESLLAAAAGFAASEPFFAACL
jgi:hypothetical protein